MKKVIGLVIVIAIIAGIMYGVTTSDIITEEEAQKEADHYTKATYIGKTEMPDELGKTHKVIYRFKDKVLGFEFEVVAYKRHMTLFGKNFGLGIPSSTCTYESKRDIYFAEQRSQGNDLKNHYINGEKLATPTPVPKPTVNNMSDYIKP